MVFRVIYLMSAGVCRDGDLSVYLVETASGRSIMWRLSVRANYIQAATA